MPKVLLRRTVEPWTTREIALIAVMVEQLNAIRVPLGLSVLTLEDIQAAMLALQQEQRP